LHRFRDTNAYFAENLRRHMTLTTPTSVTVSNHKTNSLLLGTTCAQNLTILSSVIPEKFKGCKILKWITWPGPRPFQWWSAIRRQTFDSLHAYKIGRL